MRPARVESISGRILRQFRHDPRSLALIAIVPLMVMALVGYLLSEGKERLPVAVVDLDAGADTPGGHVAIGSEVVKALQGQNQIEVRIVRSAAEARNRVGSGDVAGAVVLTSGLSQDVIAGQPSDIRVVVGGTDPGLEGPVMRAVGGALASLRASGTLPVGGERAALSLQVERVPIRGANGLSTLDYYAPVMIAVFAFLFTFMLTSVAFLRERSTGTLERLMASPATRIEVILGYLLGFIGFAMVQAVVILGYAVWVLDVRVAGSIWLVLLIIAVLVIGVVSLGITLSFYARNELQVVQFIPLIFVPQVFLGGLIWPVQTLWPGLRWLSQLLPLTHAAVALRGVMVGGMSIGDIAGRLLALLAFSVAMVILGVQVLRNQRA